MSRIFKKLSIMGSVYMFAWKDFVEMHNQWTKIRHHGSWFSTIVYFYN